MVDRLLKRAEIEGRADDNAETIQIRMDVYQRQTAPLLDYYRKKGLLVKIDGNQPIEAVHEALCQVIENA